MKLIIAEKPEQGRTLASVFETKKNKDFLEILPNEIFPEGAIMTWAIGHLCQLVPPEKYDPQLKKWSLQTLPILPSKFQYEVTKDKRKQFHIIKKLLEDPRISEVIHAGDAGREGELIVRNILRLAQCNKPMKRLWISSLTSKAIINGFRSLLDESETKNIYYEAYTRTCSDWIVGMNASRLYSLLLQQKGFSDVFSVGRVQTPTLALIVKREKEIKSFVSEPFWEVQAHFTMNGKQFTGKWEKDGQTRIDEKDVAEKIALFCEYKEVEVVEIKSERKEYFPPYLYNLSALQADANRLFQFPPKKTLDILQGLYQKGVVSYPRSDSRFVTKGEAETFPEILDQLSQIDDYSGFFPLPVSSVIENKRFVDEKKVTDHYAIIPTEQVPKVDKLNGNEKKLYDLIVRSLIAAHYNKSVSEHTTIKTLVGGKALFLSKGSIQLEEGWKKVIPQKGKNKEPVLPQLIKGEKGTVLNAEVKESKTQPPKRFTEGQLITLMKTAGKYVEDKELEKILMKTEGLGTEATRAGIITMLKDRKYIEIKKNLVYATTKGKILIEAIGNEILASPEMTAKWEQRLKEISEGAASPKQFIEQTKKMVSHVVMTAIKESNNWSFSEEEREGFLPSKGLKKKRTVKLGPCKKCSGFVIDKGTFYGCSNYKKTNCDFTISKRILGKAITQRDIKKLLNEGETDLIQGFQGKNKPFEAKLTWDEKEQKIKFLF